jgi:hypothetical protein
MPAKYNGTSDLEDIAARYFARILDEFAEGHSLQVAFWTT